MLAVYECQNRNEKSESTLISNNLLTKSEDCAGKYQTEILLNACMSFRPRFHANPRIFSNPIRFLKNSSTVFNCHEMFGTCTY